MKKRLLSILMLITLCVMSFSACGNDSKTEEETTTEAKKSDKDDKKENETDKKDEPVGLMLHYDMTLDEAKNNTIVDKSGQNNNGTIKGKYEIEDNVLFIEDGGYVELPKGMFDGENTLTISMWLNNYTGA